MTEIELIRLTIQEVKGYRVEESHKPFNWVVNNMGIGRRRLQGFIGSGLVSSYKASSSPHGRVYVKIKDVINVLNHKNPNQ